MPSKFLVGKKAIQTKDNEWIYKGLYFIEDEIYHPQVIQMFNGVDFNSNLELNITKQFEYLLNINIDIDLTILEIKKKLEYDVKLYNKIKNFNCYFNIVNNYSKPNVIKFVKFHSTSYLKQIEYYINKNPMDYNNHRIECINEIIMNTTINNPLCQYIKKKLK